VVEVDVEVGAEDVVAHNSTWPSMKIGSVGFSYHRQLDTEILLHRVEIQHVEVLVDHFMFQRPDTWSILARLKKFLPIVAHGTGLSLGSADGLDPQYAGKLIRFLDFLQPAWFSEHIAFSRFGNHRLGNFAPLPRNEESVSVLKRNLLSILGELPCPILLENIAAPFALGGSTWSEWEFVQRVIDVTGCGLLLDLHNLHTNAVNQGFDPLTCLENLPLDHVREVHIAGGFRDERWLVDSHTRPVPPDVYLLLKRLRANGFQPVVTLEWDRDFPPFQDLLDQMARARTIILNRAEVDSRLTPRRVTLPNSASTVSLSEIQARFVQALLKPNGASMVGLGISAEELWHLARSLARKRQESGLKRSRRMGIVC
jgi:uncharacterized protein (UPF0276 family)